MFQSNRRLLKAAARIQTAYSAVQPTRNGFDLPHHTWQEVQTLQRAWTAACDRNWQIAASRQREALTRELEHLVNQLRSRLSTVSSERLQSKPHLRLLYEELVAAESEFDGLEFEAGEISVTTDSIALEDIELGRFQIRLHLKRLGTDSPYSIKALDPHPAASCEETTHPHVSGERLCAGEGRGAINAALAEGRLFDFFTIVNRILHTYSRGAGYVELDDWYGVRCHDCDSTVNEEDACTCTRCEERVCGDCLVGCGECGEGFCSGCIERCYRCEEYSCIGCLTACDDCRRYVCGACHTDDVCETCLEQREEEPDEEVSMETSPEPINAPAQPTL